MTKRKMPKKTKAVLKEIAKDKPIMFDCKVCDGCGKPMTSKEYFTHTCNPHVCPTHPHDAVNCPHCKSVWNRGVQYGLANREGIGAPWSMYVALVVLPMASAILTAIWLFPYWTK